MCNVMERDPKNIFIRYKYIYQVSNDSVNAHVPGLFEFHIYVKLCHAYRVLLFLMWGDLAEMLQHSVLRNNSQNVCKGCVPTQHNKINAVSL